MSNKNNKLKIRRILDSYLSDIDIIRFNRKTGLYEVCYRNEKVTTKFNKKTELYDLYPCDEKVTKYLTNRDIITIAIDEFLNENKWMSEDSIMERRKLLLIIMTDYYEDFIKKEFDSEFLSKFLKTVYSLTANHIKGYINQCFNIDKVLYNLRYVSFDKTCNNFKQIKVKNDDSAYYYYYSEFIEDYIRVLVQNKDGLFIGTIIELGIFIADHDKSRLFESLDSIISSLYKKDNDYFNNNIKIDKVTKKIFDNIIKDSKEKKMSANIEKRKDIKIMCNFVSDNISYFSRLEVNKIKSIINSGGFNSGHLESYLVDLLILRISEELMGGVSNEDYLNRKLEEIEHIFKNEFNKLGLALICSINFNGIDCNTNSLTIDSIDINFVKGLKES